ncbi:MAG: histone deacetylase family protein [Ilumatobacteraceae bacterium]
MTVLFATHSAYLEHLAGPRHPERPERLDAVLEGVRRADLGDALTPLEPRPAGRADLERVHPSWYLERMETMCVSGGGRLDPDTYASPGSFDAARLAAGAGLTAVTAMRAGHGDAAFCAVRPPGHHASATESMGFCMISNVAVVAASLADEGERVMVLDYDAHHGNGTQAVFYGDPRVLFVSYHQWPLYPGTGRVQETGIDAGAGTTLNIPLPAGATGDVYLRAFDEIVAPVAERFDPTWVIVSAGFDAHRDDPLTDMGLAAGDYGPLTARVLALVPAGRRLEMLEGGYDLDALASCSAEVMRELAGLAGTAARASRSSHEGEGPTSAGPGSEAVDAVARHWQQLGWL